MKKKDLFVALSFTVFAVGLGLLIKETSNISREGTVSARIAEAAQARQLETVMPAAGEETAAVQPPSASPENTSDKINLSEAKKLRFMGSPDAPVVIENFSALSCSHCASFHANVFPLLKSEYIDKGKVRIVFVPFPINEASIFGAKLLQCIPATKFDRMIELLYSNQSQWALTSDPKSELFNLIRITGISQNFYNECLADKDIEDFIRESARHGAEDYGIAGTPSFVFNNGKEYLRGEASYGAFVKKIDALLNETAK